jgi:hypothetical protein
MPRLSRPTASVNRTQEGDKRLWAGHDDAALAFAQGGKPPMKLQHCVRSIWLEQQVAMPASCSLIIPMICDSLKWLFLISSAPSKVGQTLHQIERTSGGVGQVPYLRAPPHGAEE